MKTFDPNNYPYAEWLEKTIQIIMSKPVNRICILAETEDDEIISGYYNCDMPGVLMFSGYLQQKAIIDRLVDDGLIEDIYEDEEEDEEDY